MTETLGEIGKALTSISDAVKTLKLLQEKNGQLYRILEETKEQAAEVEKLQIPDEPLLQDLKRAVRNVFDSGSRLEKFIQNFGNDVASFESSVRRGIRGSTIPPEVTEEFCQDLNKMHIMTKDFHKTFEDFIEHMGKAQEISANFAAKMKQKQEEMLKKAGDTKARGIAGTIGLGLAGAGLVALGFFTGGAAWVAAGVVGGAAFGAGAGAVGATAAASVKEMRQLASGILKEANKLDDIAKSLKSSCEKAGEIKLDKAAVESLQTALEFFKRDQDKDARIAALEARLQSLGYTE